ncbi:MULTISPECIES: hypothetical protein [Streptomyces]|uniref:DUF3558 domain-containing protein n=1 Tax=Streptomyces salyersiae TaxID=3075530 RepID=A0ABU2RIK4_9ACTN|nr:hypothetical protein [Streptomyces sp. DSM 41770]MDT0428634.1 hypothetical protein [Streptomyces sp. DSM 41770]
MSGYRHVLPGAAVLAVALLAGCQGGTDDGAGGDGVPVSVERLAEMADEVGPDGSDTCPLPYDFAKAASTAKITGEAGDGAAAGDDEPAATAENGYKAEKGAPFADNPGGLVSCWFHVGGQSVEVHLVAAEKPQPESLLAPVLVRVSGQDAEELDPYLRRTEKGEPGTPVLGTTGDYATVRVEPEGEGHAALLLTLGEPEGPGLGEDQLSALSRALYEQIS